MAEIISIANGTPGISYSQEKPKVEELIPQHIRENAQGLIEFLQDYYDYINQEGLPSKQIQNIVSEHDIDAVSAKFLDGIQGEIAKNIPNSTVMNRVELYKKIVKYYGIKGSEESVTVFFRIFYDEIVSVSYPKEKLFKLSSGKWKNRNAADERQIRANFISGTLTANQIGTEFNIYNLAGDIIGSAELSSFTSIDQSFDLPLDGAGLEIKFEASDITSITFNGSNVATNWTETSDDIGSRITVDVENNAIYDLDENVFKFDGTDDLLRAVDAASKINIANEHTLIARIARNDNVTGEHDQCIVALTNPNNPHQGLELYLDRTSGRIGRRIENLNREMIRYEKSDEITLHNFPEVWALNGTWFLLSSSYNGKFAWTTDPDKVSEDPATLVNSENTIYHDGTKWVIYSKIKKQIVYSSQATSTLQPYDAGLTFTIVMFPGGLDTFSFDAKVHSSRVLVTDEYVFYRYNLQNLLLFKWDETNSVYYYHTKMYSNSPILSFDYDSANRKVSVGDYINNEVRIYDLDPWDRFQLVGTILPEPSQQYLFGFSTAIRNNKVYVGRFDMNNEEFESSNLYQYDISDLNSYTTLNHSYYAKVFSNDAVLSTRGANGLNVSVAGSDDTIIPINNDIDKPIAFEYDTTKDEIIVGNSKVNEVTVYEKNNIGFWFQVAANSSAVDVQVTTFDSGDTETIAWGDFEESFITDNTGITLSFAYTLLNDNSGAGIPNWNIKQVISAPLGDSAFGSNLALDGNNLVVASKNQNRLHTYLHNGTSYDYVETVTVGSEFNVARGFDIADDKLLVATGEGLEKIYFCDYADPNGSQTLLTYEFNNTPTQYGFSYGISEMPVLNNLTKYYTAAIRGVRDRVNGYIEVSVSGAAWERLIEGDTWEYLDLYENNDLTIGANTNESDLFNGALSNVYLYNRLISAENLLTITEYLDAINHDWYIIEFDNLVGTLSNANRIIEKNNEYIFDSLSSYEVDAFWEFEEAKAGGSVSIDVKYGDVITKTQRVNWGDDSSQAFVKQSNGNKLRHIFVGSVLGKYEDTKGQLSHVYKLHDGDYWQEYSYVINPSITPSVWEKEFLNLVHPAGMKYIAALLLLIPRTTEWIGPNIIFDAATQKYIWNKPGENYVSPYRTQKPLYDVDWMKGLLPPWLYSVDPFDGYHSSMFQPGWLEGFQSFVIALGGILYPNGANASELARVTDITLRLMLNPVYNRNKYARDDYKQNLKFKDEYEFSDYLYIPISEAIEDYSDTENVIRFNNFPSIITFSPKLPDCIEGGNSATFYGAGSTIDGGTASSTYDIEPGVDGGTSGTVICPPLADGGNAFSTFGGVDYDGETSGTIYDPQNDLDGGHS